MAHNYQTLEELLEINILEESSLADLLLEAIQCFPSQSKDSLKYSLQKLIESRIKSGTLVMYRYGENEIFIYLSIDEALQNISAEAWDWGNGLATPFLVSAV